MSETRAKIADAKRRGTKQGSIGYYGCIDICNTFMEILNEAEKFVYEGEYFLAFSMITLVVMNNAKLDWEDFSYSILISAANLSTKENVSKLYGILDEIVDKRKNQKYSTYKEWNCLVRIKAIRAVDGTCAAEEYANKNL